MRYLIIIILLLAACAPQPAVPTAPLPTAQVSQSESTPVPVGFSTYRDPEAGLALDYPDTWTVVVGETQSRGSYVQIESWDPGPDGITSLPAGESILQIAIFLWEPINDLDARVNMRRDNFTGSGNQIIAEEEVSLNGERAVRFQLLTTDGSETLMYLLVLGDRYLELSGIGDLATLDAAMRTLRIGAAAQ